MFVHVVAIVLVLRLLLPLRHVYWIEHRKKKKTKPKAKSKPGANAKVLYLRLTPRLGRRWFGDTLQSLTYRLIVLQTLGMTHSRLVDEAVHWLRARHRCGIVLSEQSCSTGETPDAIGWKGRNHSVVVECKVSRADFLADAAKTWRKNPECALGCERFYLAPIGIIHVNELPAGWGLLEIRGREIQIAKRSRKNLRSAEGLANEMNLLLASLRRVEVRIEPQMITDFLKWKNRMARYNGGILPQGLPNEDSNLYLSGD